MDLDMFANSANSDSQTKIKSSNHIRFQRRQKENTPNYGFALIDF